MTLDARQPGSFHKLLPNIRPDAQFTPTAAGRGPLVANAYTHVNFILELYQLNHEERNVQSKDKVYVWRFVSLCRHMSAASGLAL